MQTNLIYACGSSIGNLCDIQPGQLFGIAKNSIFNVLDPEADPKVTNSYYNNEDTISAEFCGWQGEQISCRKRTL